MHKFSKYVILFTILIMSSIESFAYGVTFNDDLQKIELDYYYYDGLGQDKVVQRVNDGSWHIMKPDGSLINLKGKYMYFIGTEGKNLNFDDDYYHFLVGDEKSTRGYYVDRNGLECFVEGYTYVEPTKGANYFILRNGDGSGYETGLYHKYDKKVVIPAIYDNLNYYSDNRILACKNGIYGLMNINQEEIIPFTYKYLDYINDNFIIAVNEIGKYGVINIENKVIHLFEYDDIYNIPEYESYLRISRNGKFGLINAANSKIIIPLEYDDIEYAKNEMAVASKDGKRGVIDLRNKVIVPFIYDGILYNDDGFLVYKDGLAGFLNRKGKVILPVKYYSILEVKDGLIYAVINDEIYENKYVIYDINGNEIVPPIYNNIDFYATDKYIVATKDWYANFIDIETLKGLLDNSPVYFQDIKYINDKYYGGGTRNSYAIVNFAGQIITPKQYEDVIIINVNGEELIAGKYRTGRLTAKFDYYKQTKGPSSWAVEEVSKAVENNLVPFEYQTAFTFNIKRYEFCSIIVKFLEQYYNITREDIIENNNIDVVNPPIVDGFNEDVAICLKLGIVNGRGNGIFDGESEITREEAAVMLTNLAKYIEMYTVAEGVYLNDKSEISTWSKDAVNFVLRNGFMRGVGNNMFSPKSNLTREQTYIIIYRMLDTMELANENGVK